MSVFLKILLTYLMDDPLRKYHWCCRTKQDHKKNNPIQCKLIDFRESRSVIHQTRTVLAARIKHIATEQLSGKCHIKQATQED